MANDDDRSAGGTGGAGGAGGVASVAAGSQAGASVAKPSTPAGSSGKQSDAGQAKDAPESQKPGQIDDDAQRKDAEQDEAPALGAGGTSAAAPVPGADNGLGDKGASGAKMAGAAAAVPAAGAAGQIMLLAMFINYLKGLMMTMMAIGSNLWGLALGLALGAAKAVVGAVMGIGGVVSGAVGGAISAVTAGVSSVIAGVSVAAVVLVGAVAGVTNASDLTQKDGGFSCTVNAQTALADVEGSNGSVDAKTLENAKTIYGVLSAWGMPDENIAGIVGNWDAESGVDPTSVQGYFKSPQVMSDEKKSAASNTDNGIGLGQWTSGRNSNLRAYADGHGKDWWTLEMQLGFMLSAAEGSDANIVKGMIATSQGTPSAAALYFHDKWERSADTPAMAARRGEKATKWMGTFGGWEKNQALADSILAQAGTTVTGANGTRAEAVRSECLGVGNAQLTMKEGGLTLEEATRLMEVYKVEGEAFLRGRYGAGGPGDCGYGKADNCVGFSTYFVNKFTSFQQYAMGNGVDTAGSMARMMGKELSNTPKPYSVASGQSTVPAGHTFIVLGIQGDQAVIGEASCGSNHVRTRARLMPLSELTSGAWEFVDVSDRITAEPKKHKHASSVYS